MSVLIKGMEMPTIPQTVIIYPDGTVVDVYSGEQYAAVLVPKHGRLIDADEFIKGHCNLCDGACENTYCDCLSCKDTMRCDMIQDFADAPTIIPAEEEER